MKFWNGTLFGGHPVFSGGVVTCTPKRATWNHQIWNNVWFGLQKKAEWETNEEKDAKNTYKYIWFIILCIHKFKVQKKLENPWEIYGSHGSRKSSQNRSAERQKYDQSLSEPEFFTWPVTNGDYASDLANHYGNYLADRKFFRAPGWKMLKIGLPQETHGAHITLNTGKKMLGSGIFPSSIDTVTCWFLLHKVPAAHFSKFSSHSQGQCNSFTQYLLGSKRHFWTDFFQFKNRLHLSAVVSLAKSLEQRM